MRLTTMTTYAVQAMLDLADKPAGTVVSLREIAGRQGIKVKYLEQIFMKLAHAGLVKSKKGPGGGYCLHRPVNAIKIGEIMEAVGESRAPVRCLIPDTSKHCSRLEYCSIRPYWKRMKETIDEFLDSSTLYDIIQEKNKPT
ncbi:MAG: Rrf2 family transcriptional regulator [candidate division WOR-3 bacterium]|nr:MAG: Rrf2 family transcriptional regulator [candidate division WOR-3 bacterium]